VARAGTEIAVYANEPDDPVLPVRRMMVANATIRFVYLYAVPADELAAAVTWTAEAVAVGALRPLPVTRYALDDVVAAQDAVQAGAVGKVLLTP
jgi:NADPH2:quinone reductase